MVALQSSVPSRPSPALPVHIRATRLDAPRLRSYVHRKLDAKLGKFARSIDRVSVRLEDANGPRGGVDQVCRIKVALRGQQSVVYESRDASLNATVDLALAGVQRAVRRATQRRRTKPLR